ncbi:PQQ-binding-like beta-propeller repeat protein [Pikeienuella piscinae]|uniref:PQQ-binding-like beta-propeller repeat protein n=1 Tax=Pikeienuella piscinae TaxID=2748098 RepID=A0A7L5BSY8_9RHOB|nr:PQQ-binding-like beta-propeller repeat protein [Pikeienuella piscinae]QIE54535.1 PQQ-binding-like beta-propeller repeat protein [Pikeienuella piscinae]
MIALTRVGFVAGLITFVLSGCGYFEDDEEILPGERIPVRAVAGENMTPPDIASQISAISPPKQNAEWTQVNAGPTHAIGNVAGPASLSVAWRADIGYGGERLTATPVVAGGRVFTLDSEAQVSAFSTGGGGAQWRRDLSPEGESGEVGFGGGLAFESGRLFVTTGFGQVVALDAASGEEIWRQKLPAPVRAAPAVSDGVVVVVARDNTSLAFAAEDGAVRWRVAGAASDAGVFGGASPAISPGGVAILPFGSGELIAVRATSGQRLWSDVLSGGRRGQASSVISDISSDPVIIGVAVIAGNQSGRLAAIDGRSGRRGWTRDFGARGPVWADGQTLFLITDNAELKRLSGQDGSTMWTTPLQEYRDQEDRTDAITYGGPVLAGGRLLVTSSEGEILTFDPLTGASTGSTPVSGLVGLGPVVAGGVVYVITDAGELVALR